MGQFSIGQIVLLLLSIAMWVGAAAVIVIAARKMELFKRRPK